MKPNPDKNQAMVLGKTEDKLNFKLVDFDIKTTEKTIFQVFVASKCSDKCSEQTEEHFAT